MEGRRDEAGYAVFVRFGGQRGPSTSDAVSRSALRLHVYAILAGIECGEPGFVSDEYLDAVTVDTSSAAIELCTAGLWQRRDADPETGARAGYVVLESETMRIANEVHRQLEDLSAQCRATGGHVPDGAHPGLCRKCGVRLDV